MSAQLKTPNQHHPATHAIWVLVLTACLFGIVHLTSTRSGGWMPSQETFRLRALTGSVACTDKTTKPPCSMTHQYFSSELEQAWLGNVSTWQDAYCSNLKHTEALTQQWLKASAVYDAALQRGPGSNPIEALKQQQMLDPRVFSRFETTIDCGAGRNSTKQVTWIEPLAHGLRHPDSLCNRGTTVFNRTYLVVGHGSEIQALRQAGRLQCQGRPCQSIYFDLGATVLQPGPAEAGQGWFYHTYAKQGITFDRYLLWEAKQKTDEEILKNVPKQEVDKYQYYNVPVSADTKDASSPVNILKRIAQPGDFVVFKLDIDNWQIEAALVKALLNDPEALALVDEFYHEDHINFSEMLQWWSWNKQFDPEKNLAASYQQFLKWRQLGVRAHAWV